MLEVLRADCRFARTGRARATRWSLAEPPRCFDVAEAAARWGCDLELAREFLLGEDGFLARGYVRSLNGNGQLIVTERGLAAAYAVASLKPSSFAPLPAPTPTPAWGGAPAERSSR